MRFKDTGRSVFIIWEELDPVINRWAKETFSEIVSGGTERDDSDFNVTLTGLQISHNDAFVSVFEKYDSECEFEAAAEFPYNVTRWAELPMKISIGIVSSLIEEKIGFAVRDALAMYDGVLFFENKRRE